MTTSSEDASGPPQPALTSDRATHAHPAPLGKFAARGFVWQTGAAVAIKVTSIVANLVLAKLLAQDDFGVIALAYSITFLGGTFANAGVSDVLVQRQARLHLWINPGFWLSMTCGIAGALITLLMAPVAALVFGDNRLIGLIAVIAVGIPLYNFATIPDAILQSQLRFRLTAAVMLVGALAQAALTIIFAWVGFGAYSFALPPPIVALASGILKWCFSSPRVRVDFQIRRWRFLIGDTSAVFGVRLLSTFLGQADYMILGLLYPKPIVGAYYFAFNLAVQVTRLAVGNFNSVLYPTLSRLQDHPQRQVDATLRTARMIVTFCIPLFFVQAAVASPVEQLLFAGKWRDAVPIMQILSIGMAITSAGWVTEPFLRSLGQFKFYLRFVLGSTPIVLAMMYFGARAGLAIGVAYAVVASWFILHLLGLSVAMRRRQVPLLRLVQTYALPLPVASIVIGAAYLTGELLALSPLLKVISCVTVGLAGYAWVMHWLAPDVLTDLRARLPRR